MIAKKILTALISTLSATSVYASQGNDFGLFVALNKAGAYAEQVMGSTYLGVSDLSCARTSSSSPFLCEMIDNSTENYGRKIVVPADQVDGLLMAIIDSDGTWDGYTKSSFQIAAITCKSSAANHATCVIEVK